MVTPTSVRALDQNGDWTFGGGKSNYIDGNAAVAQNIKCGLLEFVGNCFWNPQAGLNWPNLFAQKSQTVITLAVSAIILNTNGVTGLVQQPNVTLNRVTRSLSVTYNVTTVYSKYSLSQSVTIPMSPGGRDA